MAAYLALIKWANRKKIHESSSEYSIIEKVFDSCERFVDGTKTNLTIGQVVGYAINIAELRLTTTNKNGMLSELLTSIYAEELSAKYISLETSEGQGAKTVVEDFSVIKTLEPNIESETIWI